MYYYCCIPAATIITFAYQLLLCPMLILCCVVSFVIFSCRACTLHRPAISQLEPRCATFAKGRPAHDVDARRPVTRFHFPPPRPLPLHGRLAAALGSAATAAVGPSSPRAHLLSLQGVRIGVARAPPIPP